MRRAPFATDEGRGRQDHRPSSRDRRSDGWPRMGWTRARFSCNQSTTADPLDCDRAGLSSMSMFPSVGTQKAMTSQDEREIDPFRVLTEWMIAALPKQELPGLEEILNRPKWMARAACRGQGPSAFFVEPGESLQEAQQCCASCPVRGECLDFAVSMDPGVRGYWGGTSERQRRKLRLHVG